MTAMGQCRLSPILKTMANAIFLNVDLDLQSTIHLSRLVDELGDAIDVIANYIKDGIHHLSMEVAIIDDSPDGLVQEYAKLLDNMSIDATELFNQCIERSFEFGYEGEPTGSSRNPALQARLSAETLQTLARLNATTVVTTYWRLDGTDNDKQVQSKI